MQSLQSYKKYSINSNASPNPPFPVVVRPGELREQNLRVRRCGLQGSGEQVAVLEGDGICTFGHTYMPCRCLERRLPFSKVLRKRAGRVRADVREN